jgi:hypothetical protein
MDEIERKTRALGRKEFIKFRRTKSGIVAYFWGGVTKGVFESWENAHGWLMRNRKNG